MEKVKILINLSYAKGNVPVVEQVNMEQFTSMGDFEKSIRKIQNNGFMYICITCDNDINKIVWIIDYLKNKMTNIEINVSESRGLNDWILSNMRRNICFKINSNSELRKILDTINYTYGLSVPENIFIDNYDELIKNKYIRDIKVVDSNLFLTTDLLKKFTNKVKIIQINNLNYNIYEYRKVSKIVETLTEQVNSKNEFEKFMIVYNYLVNTIEYNKSSLNKDSIKGALCDKSCVCEGYVEALNLLLNKVGIENNAIYGNLKKVDSKGFPEHVWSQVKINGKWYNCDVTWDSMQRNQKDNYEYCLVSDKEFKWHYPLKKNQNVRKCNITFDRDIIKREINNLSIKERDKSILQFT